MVIVQIILSTLPEKQKEVRQTLLSMIEPPANGNGLLSYGIYHDLEDITIFKLMSEWESRHHLNVHLNSDRFGVLLGTKSLLSKPIDIKILTVIRMEGMNAVKKARGKSEKQ